MTWMQKKVGVEMLKVDLDGIWRGTVSSFIFIVQYSLILPKIFDTGSKTTNADKFGHCKFIYVRLKPWQYTATVTRDAFVRHQKKLSFYDHVCRGVNVFELEVRSRRRRDIIFW